MADENEESGLSRAGATGPDNAAFAVLGAASRDKADAFLARQTQLSELQMENLRLENRKLHAGHAFELSHVRFRRFSDYAKFSLEVAGFLVVLLMVCGLITMVWTATRDHDLVVDAFSVPPDIAQRGTTGAVLAGRVLDSFGAMENGTIATTQAANSYRSGGAQELRVEIPETGISIGELNRFMREWLGHETHVSGDLVHAAKGLSLTLRYGGAPGTSTNGGDLDELIQKSAEHLFAASTPLRYGEYLMQHDRTVEALAAIIPLTVVGSDKERALAYADWAQLLLTEGDYLGGLEKSREAVRLDPQNPTAMGWLQAAEGHLGHEEASWVEARADVPLWNGPDSGQFDPALVAGGPHAFAAYADELNGDFLSAIGEYVQAADAEPGWDNSNYRAVDLAEAHDISRARMLLDTMPAKTQDGRDSLSSVLIRYYIAGERCDWKSALTAGQAEEAIDLADGHRGTSRLLSLTWPRVAYAEAMGGQLARARDVISKTSPDCDECMRTRARIAALSGDFAGMAREFAIVADRSPHIPFADTDWGELLLRKGDLDSATTKFELANKKGPHFADPLELWGEALMQENRSDLALAKFEEANKYAPNWGRLHLEWGKALFYAGRTDEARKQFAAAASLDLSRSDKAGLTKWSRSHG
jgi:tetratricopeptide (TPR) repeat protein